MTSRKLRVGIVDLVERQSSNTIYGRMLNANFASIMPQAVAVWAEQLGHSVEYITYTGFEDLRRELPEDVDIVFINSFTQAAYLAYSISNLYRRRGVVTVLGGPHARAYAEDARDYFDYVVGLADRDLIDGILRGCAPACGQGAFLSAVSQPSALPGVRERWKYVRKQLAKTRVLHIVQILGSLGCPYKCDFCIDAEMEYRTLPYDQLREDLKFLLGLPSRPKVAWVDPNFGVRFDEYLDLIESAVPPGSIQFVAESSLSLLSEAHLKRLQHNRFMMLLPGVESWFDYNDKAKQGRTVGMDKVRAVADHINLVMRYVPYVQTNFIFGWDSDAGAEPFELTKRFLDLAPGVYPKFSLLTSFGNSAPLNREYQAQNRVLDVPFLFLDGYSSLNIRMKNYTHAEFFDQLIGLMRHTLSARMIWNRFRANQYPLGRWMNVVRALSSERTGGAGAGMVDHYGEFRARLDADPRFRAFYAGESARPPEIYQEKTRRALGPFVECMPEKVLAYFEHGEPSPNPRTSNMLGRPSGNIVALRAATPTA
jgi:hypothetical protein